MSVDMQMLKEYVEWESGSLNRAESTVQSATLPCATSPCSHWRGLGAWGGHILFVRRAAACSAASLAADDASLRCQLWHRRVPPASVGGGSKLSKCVESGAATCSSKRPSVLGLSAASAYGEALSCLRHASERPTLRPRPRSVRALHLCEPPVHLGRARAALPRRSGLDAPLPQRSRPRRGGDSARRGDLSYSQRWRRRARPHAR